jgi:hypothetical protein
LDPSSNVNDLIVDATFASSGWVSVYHSLAPYLEHNSHIHFHAGKVNYSNAIHTDSFGVLNFWPNQEASINNTFGVFSVYFPSWFEYTKQPPVPIPSNKEYYFKWTEMYGTEWDLNIPI